jgi:hypothetical protein
VLHWLLIWIFMSAACRKATGNDDVIGYADKVEASRSAVALGGVITVALWRLGHRLSLYI